MLDSKKRNLKFVGSSLKDLKKFPDKVKRQVGFELDMVQNGELPKTSKSLKGFSGVMELVHRYDKDTYRCVYVINIGNSIYVLHCFKKKSKHGIKTPREDLNVIEQRLKQVLSDSS